MIPRPNTDVWVFGGTKTLHVWNVTPDAKVSEEILERCCVLLGVRRADIEVVGVQVGLRPGRMGGPRVEGETVELEEEGTGDKRKVRVVHQYGHAGAGFQNAIGSSRKALRILEDVLMAGQRDEVA